MTHILVAFCPGKLVHTNDITVLLGDNYFADVSAKTARKLVEHRKDLLQERINRGKEASELVDQRKRKLEEVDDDIIKEPISENDEISLSEERISRTTCGATKQEEIMKQLQEKLRRTKLRSDDEIWQEIKQKETGSSTRNEPEVDFDGNTRNFAQNETSINELEFEDKHVHFAEEESSEDDEIQPPLKINFTFSNVESKRTFSNDGSFKTPWDIYQHYKNSKEKKTSILKHTSSENPVVNELVDNKSIFNSGDSGSFIEPKKIIEPKIRIPPKRTQTAFTEEVQERVLNPQEPVQVPTKRPSLFKQRRMKR